MGGKGRRSRGAKPDPAGQGSFVPVTPLVSTGQEKPKFSFEFVQRGFCVKELSKDQQAAVANTLQERSQLTWNEITQARRHGQGFEHMPAAQIKPAVPVRFSDQEKFVVFRYSGRLPMVGTRVGDVFYILWIERRFGEVYDHG